MDEGASQAADQPATATRPATAATPRRSQAERRASTRAQLLDATLACLMERGYAATTTAEIEARAGVSRGARIHHFPTKALLLTAAVDHLYLRIAERYAAAMAGVAEDRDDRERFSVGFRLLWETYTDASFAAVLELFVAARQDAELRQALRQLSTRHHQEVRRRANEYFPNLARREFDGLLESLQAALTGLAVRRVVFGESVREERVLDLIETMVTETFVRPSARPRSPS